jgi:hypothetical protein
MKYFIKCPKCDFKSEVDKVINPTQNFIKVAIDKQECPSCGARMNFSDALGILTFLLDVSALKLPLRATHLVQLIDKYFKGTLGLTDVPEILIEEEMQDKVKLSAPRTETSEQFSVAQPPRSASGGFTDPNPEPHETTDEYASDALPEVPDIDPGIIQPVSVAPRKPAFRKVIREGFKATDDSQGDHPAIIQDETGLIETEGRSHRGLKLTQAELDQFKDPDVIPVKPLVRLSNPNKMSPGSEKLPGVIFFDKDKLKAHMTPRQVEFYDAADAVAEREAAQVTSGLSAGPVDTNVLPEIQNTGGAASRIRDVLNSPKPGHTIVDNERAVVLPKISSPSNSGIIFDKQAVLSPKKE